eukprot:3935393-Rhodomonas_salina.2
MAPGKNARAAKKPITCSCFPAHKREKAVLGPRRELRMIECGIGLERLARRLTQQQTRCSRGSPDQRLGDGGIRQPTPLGDDFGNPRQLTPLPERKPSPKVNKSPMCCQRVKGVTR